MVTQTLSNMTELAKYCHEIGQKCQVIIVKVNMFEIAVTLNW